jgi:hypothetical protein
MSHKNTCLISGTKLLITYMSDITERTGFDLPSLCNILDKLILQLNSNKSKDLNSLVDLLQTVLERKEINGKIVVKGKKRFLSHFC